MHKDGLRSLNSGMNLKCASDTLTVAADNTHILILEIDGDFPLIHQSCVCVPLAQMCADGLRP